MFHSTNGNDFCSETGSSTASLLCGSTVGYPSDSLASCCMIHPCDGRTDGQTGDSL